MRKVGAGLVPALARSVREFTGITYNFFLPAFLSSSTIKKIDKWCQLVYISHSINLLNTGANMFLAPLNYDKYFNKVFSNENISRRFLEDFLETEIQEFEMLKGRHRVTDDASLVEFDFRCRIGDAYVILDMQQWYKRDISQRFYLYHALNTGLQLEDISGKRLLLDQSYHLADKKSIKDYRALQPVITLIWMADDALGFRDDYVAYTMTPELVTRFVRDEKLWHNPEIIELLEERARVLQVMDNKTKELDFLSKNRLIFMLQKNIVKSKTNAKYRKWFDFAAKTKNPNNKEEDFREYMDDEIFCEMMRRLEKEKLNEDDFLYIENETEVREEVERFERQIFEDGLKYGKRSVEQEEKERIEKNKAFDIARKLKSKGLYDHFISDVSGLTLEEVSQL